MADTLVQVNKDEKTPKPKSRGLQGVLKNVTKDLYKRNYELAQTNKTLSLLRSIDTIALASHESIDIFCDKLTEAIVKTAEFPFVGILTNPLNHHKSTTYHGFSDAAQISDNELLELDNLHINADAEWYKSGYRVVVVESKHLLQHGVTLMPYTHKQAEEFLHMLQSDLKVKSVAVVKLSSAQKVVGVMVIGFQQDAHSISKEDMELINRLGDSIGVAVESKLLIEENQLIVNQLKLANNKLKALDETKDDFISMASHQLRTPLTSVKGYLSMVIDGDAGTINKEQKEMLNQAFFSSQRMVYLIADLLNVSRLRTGKFVIEPSPVNLAEMVEEELGQLKEAVAGKSLKLSYDKPKSFPDLMLDETKTRQVIMNFVDNAIYYTPSGGEIKVKLADTASSVELRVEDNGIGVPKAEQHHLFSKFYRAGNARKARPDGTGLGLFMAKKVVLAEGGSTIFESTEGKGSTFGFVFPKSKLAPKDGGKMPVKEEPTKEKEPGKDNEPASEQPSSDT